MFRWSSALVRVWSATCRYLVCVTKGTHCRLLALQQPEQRCTSTQGGHNRKLALLRSSMALVTSTTSVRTLHRACWAGCASKKGQKASKEWRTECDFWQMMQCCKFVHLYSVLSSKLRTLVSTLMSFCKFWELGLSFLIKKRRLEKSVQLSKHRNAAFNFLRRQTHTVPNPSVNYIAVVLHAWVGENVIRRNFAEVRWIR